MHTSKMINKYIKIITIAMFLASCQFAVDRNKNQKKLDISSTSEILTNAPISEVTFVPNNIATWLGHLIMIDKTGSIIRASTSDRTAKLITEDSYIDVIGTALNNQSGVFFAINNQGVIVSFIEITNAGDFAPLKNKNAPKDFIKFCKNPRSTNSIIAIKNNGQSYQINYNINEKTKSIITTETKIKSSPVSCLAKIKVNLLDEYNLTLNEGLLLLNDNQRNLITLTISDGLSIKGTINPAGIYLVDHNMGSVFNEGLIAVSIKEENRIILLSLNYVKNEVIKLLNPS